MRRVVPARRNRTLSMANSALNYHVCYGFIQTMARQITWNNSSIIETIGLLGLVLVCGLDCDIFNLISLRLCGCLTVREQRTWESFSLCGHWSRAFGRRSFLPLLCFTGKSFCLYIQEMKLLQIMYFKNSFLYYNFGKTEQIKVWKANTSAMDINQYHHNSILHGR